jgi:membrane protease YdiL (CAAX protease family)
MTNARPTPSQHPGVLGGLEKLRLWLGYENARLYGIGQSLQGELPIGFAPPAGGRLSRRTIGRTEKERGFRLGGQGTVFANECRRQVFSAVGAVTPARSAMRWNGCLVSWKSGSSQRRTAFLGGTGIPQRVAGRMDPWDERRKHLLVLRLYLGILPDALGLANRRRMPVARASRGPISFHKLCRGVALHGRFCPAPTLVQPRAINPLISIFPRAIMTPMAANSGELVEIYRAHTLPEAQALGSALEQNGVAVRIDNEALQNAVGGLLAGWGTAPRILVRAEEEAAARALLDKLLERVRQSSKDDECLACGAAMGSTPACPACGWSYAGVEDFPVPATAPGDQVKDREVGSPGGAKGEEPATLGDMGQPVPRLVSGRALWGEIIAVLAVGIVPSLVSAVYMPASAVSLPFWVDALDLTVLSACKAFVTLYLIYRSGEPWARFGLGRPKRWDPLLGVGMFLLAEGLWLFFCSQIRWGSAPEEPNPFPRPKVPEDYLMMVFEFGASGFAEELIARAYLVTRLEQALRSRIAAVLLSAALFASYHCYQGASGVASMLAFGILYAVAFVFIRRVWPLAIGHALCNIWLNLA